MWTATLLVAIATYILTHIFIWCYKRKERQKIFKNLGIPGPKPSFLNGNLHHLQQASVPTEVISKWLKEYGNIFGYFVGEAPHLVINDISILKNILIKDFNNFTNRIPMALLVHPFSDSVLGLTNQRWKDVRGILTPTFSSSKIKTMFKIINNKVSTTIQVIDDKIQRDEQFDMHAIAEGLALDVVADTALAMKVNCQKDRQDPFLVAVKLFFESANNKVVDVANLFPILRSFLRLLVPYTIAGKMTDMLVRNLNDVIQYRRSHSDIRGRDLVQLMLDSSESNSAEAAGNDQKKKVKLTDDEIVANACVSLLAGFETTANAFAFTFYILVQRPDVQQKIFDEIMECNLGDDENFTFETIHGLSYLDQVINESLRLYPPVVTFITRECQSDYPIGKYVIAKGMYVVVPIWDIHHDPELWSDPWEFIPERFSPENKGKIDKIAYLPFGSGPRNCIGMRLAILELKLAVARLIKKFEFVPCEKTDHPITLICPTAMITPKNGVYVKAKLRT